MMIGMMLPSAAPMMLTFASINRNRRARRQPYVPTALFTSGLSWRGAASASPRRSRRGAANG
jgi:predicted metal-binding membrane protein